ncbi:unnamed protein product [Ilex paraguariensis]|uniref:AIR9-like A9 domain-containing protein n=1 Tax=Ilex paraguariensis TaxID=185542 RepID=A0ABC8RD19_9AQUA
MERSLSSCSTFSSWLRRRWNGSPVVIVGAEDEEYQVTLDDLDSCLVYMYTPVTEEGAKGEPQYAITDYVKPGSEKLCLMIVKIELAEALRLLLLCVSRDHSQLVQAPKL